MLLHLYCRLYGCAVVALSASALPSEEFRLFGRWLRTHIIFTFASLSSHQLVASV